MTDLPLAGVRVLEIGGGIPAAFAARWMAGFGADVVRTEGPADALTPDEEVYLLPGKRRTEATPSDLRRLALCADIVVDDGPPARSPLAASIPSTFAASGPGWSSSPSHPSARPAPTRLTTPPTSSLTPWAASCRSQGTRPANRS